MEQPPQAREPIPAQVFGMEPTGKAFGNQYALHALRERRAELTGEIAAIETRVRSLGHSLGYLDGTLALMAPNFDPATVKPRQLRAYIMVEEATFLSPEGLDGIRVAS